MDTINATSGILTALLALLDTDAALFAPRGGHDPKGGGGGVIIANLMACMELGPTYGAVGLEILDSQAEAGPALTLSLPINSDQSWICASLHSDGAAEHKGRKL